MGHLERGEKNVSFNTLRRLSDALGLPLGEFLSDEPRDAKKRTERTKKIAGDDLDGIVRELNEQRQTLEKAAGVLKDVASALGKRGQLF